MPEQRQAKLWFTSDTHFNHEAVIRMENRPYATAEEMNAALVANWNGCVRKKDTVWFLGDFAYARRYEEVEPFAASLNGRKYFVSGNHDKWKLLLELKANGLIEDCFFKLHETKIDGFPLTFTHFPMLEWNGCYHRGIQLFGHLHSSYSDGRIDAVMGMTKHKSKLYFNVGVDTNGWKPVAWETIKAEAERLVRTTNETY